MKCPLSKSLCYSLTTGARTLSAVLLGKTTESFQLADLQTLEGHVQAEHSHGNFSYQRLCLDASTGSSLFSIELDQETPLGSFLSPSNIPSSLERSDWLGLLELNATNAHDFLESIEQLNSEKLLGDHDSWSLDYLQVFPVHLTTSERQPVSSHTRQSILHSVVQRLPSYPRIALDPDTATTKLWVVNIAGESLSLLRQVWERPVTRGATLKGSCWSTLWASRPYQYSAAINFAVAEIAVDLLQTLIDDNLQRWQVPTILDPTCGSGTLLAMALDRGMNVVGCDVNPKCVEGTIANLQHLLGNDSASMGRYQVETCDSSRRMPNIATPIDGVVCNLPWGLNTVRGSTKGENFGILLLVRQILAPGTPCIFIAKRDLDLDGYKVLHKASIPPEHFSLPYGKKKPSKAKPKDRYTKKRRNSCIVIVAKAV